LKTKNSPLRTRRRIVNGGGPWLRLADAAAESLFSISHLRRAIRSGSLRAFRAPGGRELRILRDDLTTWLRSDPVAAA